MKNKWFKKGILVMLLVFSMMFIGCDLDQKKEREEEVDPNNPFKNYTSKLIRVQNLPNTGDWILMLSTGSNLNPDAFDNGIFAIGSATATSILGYTSFPLKRGTISSGPSTNNYTGTGEFFIALYHRNSKTWLDCINSETYGGNANKIKIESEITDAIRINIWNWKSVEWDWNPVWWPFD